MFQSTSRSDTFRCPICLKHFSREDLEKKLLSRGHVIPEAAGGKTYTLECKSCNSQFGREFDSHASNEMVLGRFMRMEPGLTLPIKICSEGMKAVKAKFQWESGPGITVEQPEGNRHVEPYRKCIKGMAIISNEVSDWKFDIETDLKIDPKRRDISLIHSAHLMMFYCFGYKYLSSCSAKLILNILEDVREGRNPPDISKYMIAYRAEKLPVAFRLPTIGIIKMPRRFRSFFVVLPYEDPSVPGTVRVVFLPGIGERGYKTFENLMKQRQSNKAVSDVSASLISNGPKRISKNLFNRKVYILLILYYIS
jgi:hypothetical protein